VTEQEAAQRFRPAGAVYHCMSEDDVRRILSHPATMVGSDGLPNDPLPHPRLWGAFPRVLGHYVRDANLLPLEEAIRKMTGCPRGASGSRVAARCTSATTPISVLFDPARVIDAATFEQPQQPAHGIDAVWVNGVLTYENGQPTGARAAASWRGERSAAAPMRP
jgi:N-acyl-D-amino-acid deacylase